MLPVVAVLLGPITSAHADDWDGPDKRAHFIVGFGIAANTSVLAHLVSDAPSKRALIGLGFGAAAGLGKEALDALGSGDPSAKDLVWTVIGAAAGALLVWAVDALDR